MTPQSHPVLAPVRFVGRFRVGKDRPHRSVAGNDQWLIVSVCPAKKYVRGYQLTGSWHIFF